LGRKQVRRYSSKMPEVILRLVGAKDVLHRGTSWRVSQWWTDDQ